MAFSRYNGVWTAVRLKPIGIGKPGPSGQSPGGVRLIAVRSLVYCTVGRAATRWEKEPCEAILLQHNQFNLTGCARSVARASEALAARLPESVDVHPQVVARELVSDRHRRKRVQGAEDGYCRLEGGPLPWPRPTQLFAVLVLWDTRSAFFVPQSCLTRATALMAPVAPLTTMIGLSAFGTLQWVSPTQSDASPFRMVSRWELGAPNADERLPDLAAAVTVTPSTWGVAQRSPQTPVLIDFAMAFVWQDLLDAAQKPGPETTPGCLSPTLTLVIEEE